MFAYGVLSVLPLFGHPHFGAGFASVAFILFWAGAQAVWERKGAAPTEPAQASVRG